MKKLLLSVFVLSGFVFSFSSCEKCFECSAVTTDPVLPTDTITEEVCERGHVYDNALETYERAGWDCFEK